MAGQLKSSSPTQHFGKEWGTSARIAGLSLSSWIIETVEASQDGLSKIVTQMLIQLRDCESKAGLCVKRKNLSLRSYPGAHGYKIAEFRIWKRSSWEIDTEIY